MAQEAIMTVRPGACIMDGTGATHSATLVLDPAGR